MLLVQLDVQLTTLPGTNSTMYELVSTQLYLDNPQVFDVLENLVIAAIIPVSNFVVVVVATSATVAQLKRVIVWRQRASTNVEGTEVVFFCFVLFCFCFVFLIHV